MTTVRVDVVCFAALRERLGGRATREVSRGTTVAALWRELVRGAPELRRLPVRFAVRERYVPDDYVLRSGDEVAVFPPVSGGS